MFLLIPAFDFERYYLTVNTHQKIHFVFLCAGIALDDFLIESKGHILRGERLCYQIFRHHPLIDR